jgi:hypothetical protein
LSQSVVEKMTALRTGSWERVPLADTYWGEEADVLRVLSLPELKKLC